MDSENTRKVLERYLTDDNYEMYCYEEEDILALITVHKRSAFFYGGTAAIIEDLVVDDAHRGRGIGRMLVEFVEDKLAGDGALGLELSSDLFRKGAHGFWERMGYEKSGYHFRKILDSDR